MAYPKQSKCRACDAPIDWALSEKGKRVPLDPVNQNYDGDPRAQYALYEDPDTGQDRVHHISAENPLVEPEERRVRVHFASCPARSRSPRGASPHQFEHRFAAV